MNFSQHTFEESNVFNQISTIIVDNFCLQAMKWKKKKESFQTFISFDSHLNSACTWPLTAQHPTSFSGLSEVLSQWFDGINWCVFTAAARRWGSVLGTLLIFCSLAGWTCPEPIPSGGVNKAVHAGWCTKQIQDLCACVASNDCHARPADVTCVAFGFEAGPEDTSAIL